MNALMANSHNPSLSPKAEYSCCSGANLVRGREAAGLMLTEATHPAGLRLQPHAHERVHFCLLLQGVVEENWGKQVLVREPGSLALVASGAIHSNRMGRTGVRFFTIELTRRWVERANGHLGQQGDFAQFENGPLP